MVAGQIRSYLRVLDVIEKEKHRAVVKTTRSYWLWYGISDPKRASLGDVIIAELVVSRYLYYGLSQATLRLHGECIDLVDEGGVTLFTEMDLMAFLTALRSAYEFDMPSKLPFWRRLDAFNAAWWSCSVGEDPILMQMRILRRLWRKVSAYSDMCDYVRNIVLQGFNTFSGKGRKVFATYERVAERGRRGMTRDNIDFTHVDLTSYDDSLVFTMSCAETPTSGDHVVVLVGH